MFPESAWGDPAIVLLGCDADDPSDAEEQFGALQLLGAPIVDLIGTLPYTDLQSFLDVDYPDGRNYYWKSCHLPELTEEGCELLVAAGERAPSSRSTIDRGHLVGAIDRGGVTEMTSALRGVPFMVGIEANWDDQAETDANLEWTRDLWVALQPHAVAGLYVNFPSFGEGESLLRDSYGENDDRLVGMKTRYDPTNLFDSNQNVVPARMISSVNRRGEPVEQHRTRLRGDPADGRGSKPERRWKRVCVRVGHVVRGACCRGPTV